MRKDALGIFWRDEPAVKKTPAEKIKRTPPEPTWLSPDYLPGLEEAKRFDVQLYNDLELASAANYYLPENKERLVCDIEIYKNYFIAGFKSVKTGKVVYIEMTDTKPLDKLKLAWILNNFTIVTFFGKNFDLPILAMALAGCSLTLMKEATRRIIEWREPYYEVLKSYRVKNLKIDHIDLVEVAPLFGSLKIYSGRLHAKRMQDLPFHPDTELSEDQITIVRYYNINDLSNTILMHDGLIEELRLRVMLGQQYEMDLRSRSDAQMAEDIFTSEVGKRLGQRIAKPTILPGTTYHYKTPAFIQYRSGLLQWALDIVQRSKFIVADHGSIELPKEMEALELNINQSTYTMRIGGLHSTEKKIAHVADDEYELWDIDVVSYYPWIILLLGLYPYHMGSAFLQAFRTIVETRIAAKKRGDKKTADSLKILVNGTFGKLGSKYSNLYAPDLLIQVTVTGQLALLMLIERLELQGIRVVSANTDGIVIKVHKTKKPEMFDIIKGWEHDTKFEMEYAEYAALYSRDVNNYIAIKKDGKFKTKGAYNIPWIDAGNKSLWMHKNPTSTICVEAILEFLIKKAPIATTISQCNDITKFVTVRSVEGGAVSADGTYLGKSIRWYYAEGEEGYLVYAKSGNKVPRSDGARPLMDLPDTCPTDIDYQWYIKEAEKILDSIGYK